MSQIAPMHDEELTALMHASVPLTAFLEIVAVTANPTQVELSLDWRDELTTTGGVMHGGAQMSLADAAGAFCAFLNLPTHAVGTTTIESKTNLLRAVNSGDSVTATATPLHVGGTSIVIETRLEAPSGLVAKTIQTQLVLTERT